MGSGKKVSSKCSSREQVRKRNVKSDDSDEEYKVKEDETDDQSDDSVSLVGDASEEDGFSSFAEENKEDVVTGGRVQKLKAQKISIPRKNGMKRSKKRRRIAYDVDNDDEDDKDEDYDEDDEELTSDDFDSLDVDEESSSSKGKMKKSGWHTVKKKGFANSWRRKTSANKVPRPPRKKRKRRLQRRGKSTASNNRHYTEKLPTSRGKHKRKPVPRKKKTKLCSDSDFVSSDSSAYEYTISEEEREQVREASEFCRRVNASLRSSKGVLEGSACDQPLTLTGRKGKEKVEDVEGDVGKQVCGICFTEEGSNTVRGTVNCCSHFFCFACIMEWSKVESRCPLCKQRFSTISKPARSASGLDLRNVVIHVPERDQVYQPSEEELRNYLDPYENMICTECHEGGDDALMLLCDLCDSPAHTYCVGLGHEVPNGNWYCEGCRASALGTTHSQAQDHTPTPRTGTTNALNEPSSTYENMAEIDLNVSVPETPTTPLSGFLSSPRNQGGLQPSAPVSGVGVSTLSGRRRVHRLQYLLSSNRLSQMAGIADRASTSSARLHRLSSQLGRANESSCLENRDVGTSDHCSYADRLVENPFGSSLCKENFSGRPSLIRGQVIQASGSAEGMVNGCLQWSRGVNGIHSGLNDTLGHEHSQSCSSRSNLGSDMTTAAAVPPLRNGDVDHQVVKQQLQSMVKSHLKSFCRDVDLGYETFKRIARGSTHSILAACGLDNNRSEVCEIPPPICAHSGEALVLVAGQMSPMKGCCQSCFDSFVKNVVRTFVNLRAPY